MAFISTSFVIFLIITAAAYYILPQRFKPALLLAASVYFYYCAAPAALPWLLGAAAMAYSAALLCARAASPRAKALWTAAGIVLLLGSLLYFKYYNFFAESFAGLLGSAAEAPALSLVAPAGISFYTLAAIGYLADVRRGDTAPERDPIIFAAYITFFPHIMSGPIPDAGALLPQFRRAQAFSADNLRCGARRFALGVFKKAVVAQPLGEFVDAVYYNLAAENPATVALAALLYSVYLYFDFSAYTDMALGAGRALGFELCENFNAPYFARSVTDIWARWHISLTSWLRKYVYFPLGGSRRGFARKLVNIAAVFLISGLWHGAQWGFVVWGALFALLRAAEELARRFLPKKENPSRARALVVGAVSRAYVLSAWSLLFVFFRLEKVEAALAAIYKIFDFSHWSVAALTERAYALMMNMTDSSPAFAKISVLVPAAFALLLLALECYYVYLGRARRSRPNDLLSQLPEWPRFALEILMLCAALAFGYFGASSFVYFQF